MGTLDVSVGDANESDHVTFNYYYIGTIESVPSFVDAAGITRDTDDSIGHELDLYIDQAVMEGLRLRLVGAYLFAGDAYTFHSDDDDAYELGAQLLWAF